MGQGKAFEGRVRLATELRRRTDAIGREGVDRIELAEETLSLGASWSPLHRLTLAVRAPFVRREVTEVSGAIDRVMGLGDTELRARWTLFEDRPLSSRHVVSLDFGAGVPTASVVKDEHGDPLPIHAQPGTGAVAPMIGLAWAGFAPPMSGLLAVSAWFPAEGEQGLKAGDSVRATLAGQWQPGSDWAFRLGLDARWDDVSYEHGDVEPDSGGAIVFISPEVAYSPALDVLLSAAFRMPFINRLTGRHEEGPVPSITLTWDV